MVITLMDVLKELDMTPSRARTGKGPRDEREFLRYKAHIGEITAPTGGKWQWNEDDEELEEIKLFMASFKDERARAPSGWRKLPKKDKQAAKAASDDGSKMKAAAVKTEKKRSHSPSDADIKTEKKPRKVKKEKGSTKQEADDTDDRAEYKATTKECKKEGAVKKEQSSKRI